VDVASNPAQLQLSCCHAQTNIGPASPFPNPIPPTPSTFPSTSIGQPTCPGSTSNYPLTLVPNRPYFTPLPDFRFLFFAVRRRCDSPLPLPLPLPFLASFSIDVSADVVFLMRGNDAGAVGVARCKE